MIMNDDLGCIEDQPSVAAPPEGLIAPGVAAERHEFLASMGHELRNPLSSIIAHVESLVEGIYGPLAEAQKTALASIQASARQVVQLVADVVELGKLETGGSPANPVACRVGETCEKCLQLVADLAHSRSAQVVTDIQPRNLTVMTDMRRLSQIITELLSASILTIPTGARVMLCVSSDGGGLHLRTRGSAGHSIPAKARPLSDDDDPTPSQLLGRLQRVKPIGVALLQKLVKLQQGTLAMHETAGSDVRISIHLPAETVASTVPEQEQRPPEALETDKPAPIFPSSLQPTILLADDQPALIAVTRNFLESLGFQVITARDGREAVHMALTLQPDLILMDVRMPVLDGLQAIRQIREAPDPKTRNVNIISLSGLAGAADKEKCLAAGATAYLNKPFGGRELERIVTEFARPKSM